MNGRILYLKTPAARIAAFFQSVILQRMVPSAVLTDYRDIETKITLFIEREEYLFRLDEHKYPRTPEREKQLHQRLSEIEKELAKKDLFHL